jgi:hypothetical protein
MSNPPLIWFELRDHGGRRFRVVLSCAEDDAVLENYEAMTFWEVPRCVLLSAKLRRQAQDKAIVHEILHIAYDHVQKPTPMEERVITRIGNNLLPILKQFGFKLPRRPRGVSKMEKRARRGKPDDEGE